MAGSEPVRPFSTHGLLLTIPIEFGSWHNIQPLELREHIGVTWEMKYGCLVDHILFPKKVCSTAFLRNKEKTLITDY